MQQEYFSIRTAPVAVFLNKNNIPVNYAIPCYRALNLLYEFTNILS